MKKAKIINCHQLSIRRNVNDPDELEETIATLPAGKTVLVNDSEIYWSWKDRAYYKVNYGMNKDEGYATVECLEVLK